MSYLSLYLSTLKLHPYWDYLQTGSLVFFGLPPTSLHSMREALNSTFPPIDAKQSCLSRVKDNLYPSMSHKSYSRQREHVEGN